MLNIEDAIIALADKGITEVDYFNPTNSEYRIEGVNDQLNVSFTPSDAAEELETGILLIDVTRDMEVVPVDEDGEEVEFDEDDDLDIDIEVSGRKIFVTQPEYDAELKKLCDTDEIITLIINNEEMLIGDIVAKISQQIANITALSDDIPAITPPYLMRD